MTGPIFTTGTARWLVDAYYTMQDWRIDAANRIRSAGQDGEEPPPLVETMLERARTSEEEIKRELGAWAVHYPEGAWAQSQYGIGPVLSAGLVAHIDIEKAPTVGHIWRFAGLDPTLQWGKGEKRPYNAKLKVLTWKIADSFVKFSGREDCVYGHFYQERKALEVSRDEQGLFADTAKVTLETRQIRDKATRATYEAGRLPAGRLDLRARRWAVKLFLSHYHREAYVGRFGTEPPLPYPIAHLGHAHIR